MPAFLGGYCCVSWSDLQEGNESPRTYYLPPALTQKVCDVVGDLSPPQGGDNSMDQRGVRSRPSGQAGLTPLRLSCLFMLVVFTGHFLCTFSSVSGRKF